MENIISIDLGYGYVKGVNLEGEEILLPSIVGPGHDRELADLFGTDNKRMDKIHVVIDGQDYFVGDLALEESRLTTNTLEGNKISHANTKVLLATTAALLSKKGFQGYHLATGLPIKDYKFQREELEKALKNYHAEIEFKGGPLAGEKRSITFTNVTIFPQCAGVIFHKDLLAQVIAEDTLLAIVDVGHKTTDFIAFTIKMGRNGKPQLELRTDLSHTLDIGSSNLLTYLDEEFTKRTKKRLPQSKLFKLLEKKTLKFKGEELDFTEIIELAKKQVSNSIIDNIKNIWQDETDFIEKVYLAGGTSEFLKDYLCKLHEKTELVNEPQFANAKGFLEYARVISQSVNVKTS